jgi:GNAT superfamily N-acetyltransferase
MARAFRDGPLNRVIVGSDSTRRLRSSVHGMRASLTSARDRGDCRGLWLDGGANPILAGILLGFDPGLDLSMPAPLVVQLRCLLGQGLRTMRLWAVAHRALVAVHPLAPHAYLSLIAVDPEWQGRGLGSLLLEDWLVGIDAQASAGYLETDRESLLGFYGRFGFEVRDEVSILGTRIWCCWRAGNHERGSAGHRVTAHVDGQGER